MTRRFEKLKEASILVLGATGTGKTTFINTASNSSLNIRIDLMSCTDQIQCSDPFLLDGCMVTLVDTPGFDDPLKSDAEVLNIIHEWIFSQSQKGHYLAAAIYLYRISDNRISGTTLRHFGFFEQLCEDEAIKNRAIVTNMWDLVNSETAQMRVKELKTEFLESAIDAGAEFLHQETNTPESAHTILSKLIAKTSVELDIQRGPSQHFMDSTPQVTPTTEDNGSFPSEKDMPSIPPNPDNKPSSQNPTVMTRKPTRKSEKTKKVYIAVLGATGAGKTTVRKYANHLVTAGLITHDAKIQYSEPFLLDGRMVTLVDTPGFDDTSKSDAEILNIVCKYLFSEYQKGHFLTAVIYLHRISNNRMSGSALRNFRFFEQLCGDDAIKNSAIVTNMWDNVDPQTAHMREEVLRTQPEFFRGAIEAGAKFLHHKHNTQESAHAILSKLVTNTPVALGIQRELLDQRRSIASTTAGHTLLGELAILVLKHKEEMEELQEDLIDAKRENDHQTERELEEAIETLQNATAKLQVEQQMILASDIAPGQKRKLLRKLANFGFATLRIVTLARPRKYVLRMS